RSFSDRHLAERTCRAEDACARVVDARYTAELDRLLANLLDAFYRGLCLFRDPQRQHHDRDHDRRCHYDYHHAKPEPHIPAGRSADHNGQVSPLLTNVAQDLSWARSILPRRGAANGWLRVRKVDIEVDHEHV